MLLELFPNIVHNLLDQNNVCSSILDYFRDKMRGLTQVQIRILLLGGREVNVAPPTSNYYDKQRKVKVKFE